MNVNRIDGYKSLAEIGEKKLLDTKEEKSFSNFLTNALNQVNEMQLQSTEYKKLLAVGELDNLHDLTIAADKADTALQVVMSIRSKVVEAYKEIMRIQI
ncbi:flagellar hook-basal body complex protein FliE [Tissierella carlieri]|uniref:Flagellar hook-basal body complex protein FliE n=1 Tax=Tissierella carlieri TaxID=689904 RepID=A0ABT1S5R3_9FIRM|nr:flagellar hook-basal body complex protein FliE [Tissierella carlieri]MBU5314221.1 flagellar hook-basal body complex protein FliE [Tissierella carlieri]MCQ4921799.1 flagellar hook-basal body complex protein FliE [Tissierella carlieri]